MCEYKPGEPWYSYAFRQVCEKSWAVLAIAGFVVLWWYSEKADATQQGIIDRMQRNQTTIAELMRDSLRAQADQTQAIISLTSRIERMEAKIDKMDHQTK